MVGRVQRVGKDGDTVDGGLAGDLLDKRGEEIVSDGSTMCKERRTRCLAGRKEWVLRRIACGKKKRKEGKERKSIEKKTRSRCEGK